MQVYHARKCGGCSKPLSGGDLKVMISRREAATYLGKRALPRLNLVCASCFRDLRKKGANRTAAGI